MRAQLLSVFAAVLLANAPACEPLVGQGFLLDARMDVALLTQPGPVEVRLVFQLSGTAESLDLPFTLLTPAPSRIVGLTVRCGEEEERLVPEEIRTHFWTGAIRLPRSVEPGETLSIELRYSVEGAWGEGGRITIPIPAPAWIPEDPHPRSFLATVAVPPDWAVSESFPTSVVRRPEGAGGGSYQLALQSVPSMLILRMAEGEGPFLTLERILDIVVVSILLVMGLLGVRFLRGGRG
jgi:hypothetical protein